MEKGLFTTCSPHPDLLPKGEGTHRQARTNSAEHYCLFLPTSGRQFDFVLSPGPNLRVRLGRFDARYNQCGRATQRLMVAQSNRTAMAARSETSDRTDYRFSLALIAEHHLLRSTKEKRDRRRDHFPFRIMPFAATVQHDIEATNRAEAIPC